MKVLSRQIQKAMYFAAKHHKNQVRKGTDKPYVIHPINAAMLLLECSAVLKVELSDAVITAAVLHDTLEDTEVTEEMICETFSEAVLALVQAASEDDKSLSWQDRKEATIEKLKKLPFEALLVPLADKVHNLYEVYEECLIIGSDRCFDKFNAGREKQYWYHSNIIAVLRNRLSLESTHPVAPVMAMLLEKYSHYFTLVFEADEMK